MKRIFLFVFFKWGSSGKLRSGARHSEGQRGTISNDDGGADPCQDAELIRQSRLGLPDGGDGDNGDGAVIPLRGGRDGREWRRRRWNDSGATGQHAAASSWAAKTLE